ncbi:N-formylglutamate amidohydrolase [Shimia sp. NS0008-38b]|uniref:N-formylglutamate amidohydrolase n=1 Tax=Shimia sp. NS0008-38b TaxID=3127653 RepID=UPI003103D44A
MLKEEDVVNVVGPIAPCDVMFVCEHASCNFPPELGDLGISEDVRRSHVAWDPGALELTKALAGRFGATYVAGQVSRLLYDCNRPPEVDSAIPKRSEVFDIPGNANLTEIERRDRVEQIYTPFRAATEQALAVIEPKAMVTVHSFTPVYHGARRDVEVGILHDHDARLADHMLSALRDAPFKIQRNAPYGPEDGVTHSLRAYALPNKIPNVMLEVRNDLLTDSGAVDLVADVIEDALRHGIAAIYASSSQKGSV